MTICNKSCIVIEMFGAPGCGKSTIYTDLIANRRCVKLKNRKSCWHYSECLTPGDLDKLIIQNNKSRLPVVYKLVMLASALIPWRLREYWFELILTYLVSSGRASLNHESIKILSFINNNLSYDFTSHFSIKRLIKFSIQLLRYETIKENNLHKCVFFDEGIMQSLAGILIHSGINKKKISDVIGLMSSLGYLPQKIIVLEEKLAVLESRLIHRYAYGKRRESKSAHELTLWIAAIDAIREALHEHKIEMNLYSDDILK